MNSVMERENPSEGDGQTSHVGGVMKKHPPPVRRNQPQQDDMTMIMLEYR